MKRIAAFIAVLMLFASSALADIDLSVMTVEELVALKQQIDLEIASRPEVKSVVVPVGVWKIGEDIPAGHWNMTTEKGHKSCWSSIVYCDALDETGKKISPNSEIWYRDNVKYEGGDTIIIDKTNIDLDMKDGMYLIIENAPLVFTPYTGKPDLGFDW